MENQYRQALAAHLFDSLRASLVVHRAAIVAKRPLGPSMANHGGTTAWLNLVHANPLVSLPPKHVTPQGDQKFFATRWD